MQEVGSYILDTTKDDIMFVSYQQIELIRGHTTPLRFIKAVLTNKNQIPYLEIAYEIEVGDTLISR